MTCETCNDLKAQLVEAKNERDRLTEQLSLVQCGCSVLERYSGHRSDCHVPLIEQRDTALKQLTAAQERVKELEKRLEPEKDGWHCNFCGLRWHEPKDAAEVAKCIQCEQSVNADLNAGCIEQLYADWRDKEIVDLKGKLAEAEKAGAEAVLSFENARKSELAIWAVERDRLRAENEKLRAALKPFVECSNFWTDSTLDEQVVAWASKDGTTGYPITLGHCRQARSVLENSL